MVNSNVPAPAATRAALARRVAYGQLWALPLLASLLFVCGVLAWTYHSERDERDERRATMIADALSSEAQLHDRLDLEVAHVEDLARQLQGGGHDAAALAARPEVREGLQRIWISVTWLDANNRILAHIPDQSPQDRQSAGSVAEEPGVSSHLSVPMGSEQLVVRYSPTLLLRHGIPWWLARKYDVQLIDAAEQVIASIDDVPLHLIAQDSESYKVLVGPHMPGAYLELTLREAPRAFWRTLPVVLTLGFLALMVVASTLLRRQMRRVARAEAAWRTQAAWRQAMEDSALVGLRARDASGRILYVNRTFCSMVGLSEQQLVGLKPPMPYWPPDAIDEVMLRNRRNLAGHAPREGYEALWCHQDGHRLNVMVFESALIDANGQQIGWMGSIIDITAHKALEARERRQAEAMAHQARLSTLGEIASALGHQLNQPLTAVMGYNAGLQRMLSNATVDRDALLQALRSQAEQAAQAGRIVRRIREFLTRRTPRGEPCQLDAIAQRAAASLQREMSTQGVQLHWQLAPSLPQVYADPVLLQQVLINLLCNALDALRDSPAPRRLRVRTQCPESGLVQLDVDDSGGGLDGRSVEQLSAPFYSTKAEGMGMGLAICRSVLEAHHGSLHARSSSLGGACFSIRLPVYTVSQPAALGDDAAHVAPDEALDTPQELA